MPGGDGEGAGHDHPRGFHRGGRCLKCGSLWFDNREIEPFIPDIREKANLPDDSNPIMPAISGGMNVAKSVISGLFGLAARTDDSEE